jgi:alkylation response protein AidB-like acyl-CoA dehydrogenase
MNVMDRIKTDAPMFEPAAFGLTDQQVDLCNRARMLGETKFAARAAKWDKEASFPTENFRDFHAVGFLSMCVPKDHGGEGADLLTYALAAAEIGRYCGSTALTWNMHVCSGLWTGYLADQLDMSAEERKTHERRRAIHYKRMVEGGKIYSQPFSEGGAAAAGTVAFGTRAKKIGEGWQINGKKIFASLSGHADYYGVICTEDREDASRRHTMFMAVPATTPGVQVVGDWDPLGMRGTVSRNLIFKDAMVDADEALMPPGVYYQGVMRWPHMFLGLTPTYIGLMQAAYDFTVKYLRGEIEGMPPVKRRMYPTKQIAVAQMRVMLEQTKVLWLQVLREARIDPSKDQRLRAYAMQYTAMENSNEMAQLAIRTCGGQAMLKSLPLERIYRDSRCGSLMLPWTAELCLDNLGRQALYEQGETDE